MSQFKPCIIVLKPTSFFTSFVVEQLPDFDYPEDEEVDTDTTAYSLPVCEDDDALLEQLERLFPFMFRHEVTRLIGKTLASKIKADFLDFLYCFKFEVHSQSILTEASIDDCHQLVCVKPKVVDLEWMPSTEDDQIEVQGLLQTLAAPKPAPEATVLVKRFDMRADVKPLVQRYCRPIFKHQLMQKAAQIIQWPTMPSLQTFNRYFAVEVHTQLVHLH
ncbi:MAG: hypothetical protein NXI01_08285 [Gammaproteobacteria bacterium]|nr:hypothetical protein [Gammaproteobacteria bacterium]